jgi:glycosyltransferase involved in cell wall biosynthesis
MRIGYLYGFEAYPPRGGNGVHAYQLIKGFANAGHTVVTPADSTPPEVTCIPVEERGVDAFLEAIDILYVRVDGTPLHRRETFVELMEASEVPIVWEINSPANEALAFSWLGGKPRGRSPLTRALQWPRRAFHAARQMPAIRREEAFRRHLAKRVDAAICVSASVGRYASEGLGIGDVEVIPNGSNPDLLHPGREATRLPGLPEGAFKVLYAGSPIYPWQGLDLLQEAIALSHQRGEGIHFLLLLNQEGKAPPELPNTHYLERVPYEQIAGYIRAADVCVTLQPDFDWSPWGFHGSPMKIFDYMACARPVVTSAVGQMMELVEKHRIGVTCAQDPGDLLEKLIFLRDRPEVREAMGRNARQAVEEHYNWTTIARRTMGVLERAASD